jgi:hypothetical protein
MPDASRFALPRPGWRVWVAGALAVVVIVVVLVARLSDGSDPGPGDNRNTEQSSSTGSGSPLEPVDPSGEPLNDGPDGAEAGNETSQPAAAGAMDVALAFARAWATPPPENAPDQWWAGVSRHTDQTLAEQLRDLDPTTLPASKVTGAPVSVSGGVTSAEVRVPTDAGQLLVVCVLVRGRWLAADYEFERRAS